MRQLIGPKKVRQLAKKTGLDVCGAHVRGGWDHAKLLFISGGTCVWLHKDGTITPCAEKWNYQKWLANNPQLDRSHA